MPTATSKRTVEAEDSTPATRNYCFHDGHPLLVPGRSFSEYLSGALTLPRSTNLIIDEGGAQHCAYACAVEWGETAALSCPFTLSMRFRGSVITCVTANAGEALGISVECLPLDGVQSGETVIFELSWQLGSRHLHVVLLRTPACLSFANLVMAHREPRPSLADPSSLAFGIDSIATLATNLCSPALPLSLSRLERGFGIELELVTEAGPGRPDALTSPNPGISAVLAALIRQLEASEATSARSRDSLRRVAARFIIGEDGAIGGALESVARQTVEACAPTDEALAMQLLRATPRLTHRTEVRSPAPPEELSFAHRGADDVRCLAKLLRRAGAAAPSIGRTHAAVEPPGASCEACTAVHVHVNVRHPNARGGPLSGREIVHVALAWVRFDLVTARFARAWMWRNADSCPMFATGPEYVRQRAPGRISPERQRREADIPAWFASIHALLRSDRFAHLDGDAQCDALFGPDSPTRDLSRYCSLNLLAVAKHGTLEVRRYHGSLDGELLVHWAHLVVAFVEAFRGRDAEARLLAMPVEDALRELRVAQERATAGELIEGLAGLVDRRTAALFLADAVGGVWEPVDSSSSDDDQDEGES